MKIWEDLTRIQNIFIGLFFISIVILIPETTFLLDAGGIDLIVFILFMYSQNIKSWYDLHFGMIKYPLIETQTYVKSISLTSVFFLMTSSLIFSSAFFMLFMFIKKDF